MKKLLILFALVAGFVAPAFAVNAPSAPVTANPNTGVLLTPSLFWTANSAEITAALNLSGTYQPLENQRLSTTDSVSFQELSVNGTNFQDLLNGVAGWVDQANTAPALMNNDWSQTISANAVGWSISGTAQASSVWSSYFLSADGGTSLAFFDWGNNWFVLNSSTELGSETGVHVSAIPTLFDGTGGNVLSANYASSGAANAADFFAGNGWGSPSFDGSGVANVVAVAATGISGDTLTNPSSGLWDFGAAAITFDGGQAGSDGAGGLWAAKLQVSDTSYEGSYIYFAASPVISIEERFLVGPGSTNVADWSDGFKAILRNVNASAPAHTDAGHAGDMYFTDTYTYRCFASGDWRRVAVTYSTY
ncbi:MAG: hypothetical protein WC661_22205 [Opitutaceae bacterium]|jgi:hypothetical protein